jgi:tetratricopeptide (TPR) repeat protein
MSTTPVPPVPAPVGEIERHLKWRVLPSLLFMLALAVLTTLGVVSLVMKPRHPHGLPDDPDARAASAVLAGRVTVATNALRFSAAVLGGESRNRAADAGMLVLAASARPALETVHRRQPNDPRALAALAALDLLRHDYGRAAARYRRACELAPHYAEGRLGAGVALALEADRTPDPWQSRALRLQAIAQFAMVDSLDAEYPLALYDRSLVLADAGRTEEAAFWAARYRAIDDTSRWGGRLPR